MAETISGLYKAEVIHRRGSWQGFEAVDYATLERIDWFNHRRMLEPIGNIPPAKPKSYVMLPRTTSIWQRDSQPNASGKPEADQSATRVERLHGAEPLRLTFVLNAERIEEAT